MDGGAGEEAARAGASLNTRNATARAAGGTAHATSADGDQEGRS